MLTRTLLRPLEAYADRLHRAAFAQPDPHHVVSPLGAWLLLALVAPAAERVPGAAGTDALTEALGVQPDEAARIASQLLENPHPAVVSAAVAWLRGGVGGTLREILATLPIETGDLPSQQQADAWVRDHTLGLLQRWPGDLSVPMLQFAMGTALATKVSWCEPFDLTSSAALGDGPFRSQVQHALQAHTGRAHACHLANSAAGLVAVAVTEANGVDVWSVSADPGVDAADVLRVAHDAVDGRLERMPLSQLPLGKGHSWTITEHREVGATDQRYTTVTLPQWRADTSLDLLCDPSLGFQAAAQVLEPMLPGAADGTAQQVATASFTRHGFEAAAVSAMMRAGAAIPDQRDRLVRECRLHYGHPYAVVAVASRPRDDDGFSLVDTPWQGLPVFSGWVAEASEPS